MIHSLLCSLGAALALLINATAALSAPTTPSLDYMLVVTGEELLRGVFPDAHTAFITRTLHMQGGHCVGAITVDDKAEDIRDAVKLAASKVKLVIVTGGLGPTVNDVTRGALADVTGVPLKEHPEVLAELEKRFQTARDQLRENLRRQALVPSRGGYLKNNVGTAVGLVFEPEAGAVIVALPGPPRELQPMVTNELLPYLTRQFAVRSPGSSLTLRFVGVGQSQIDQTLRQHGAMPEGVVVGSTFEGGRVDFIFALPGNTVEDKAKLRQIETGAREHLGQYLYASDHSTLEQQVVRRLRTHATSMTLVEIGSGGHLAAAMNAASDTADFLKASFVAPTEASMAQILQMGSKRTIEKHSAEDRLRALAGIAEERSGSNYVVAVGERTRDTEGKRSVLVVFGTRGKLEARRIALQGSAEVAHPSIVTQVLDILRKEP